MKCITTKYHGPTNHKGSRISVRAEGLPTKWFSYDHEFDDGGAAQYAKQFAGDLGWLKNMTLVCGVDYQGNRQFVLVPQT